MKPVLRLPTWVDDVDVAVDDWWEQLRGNPVLDRVFYTASTAGDFSAVWHGYNLVRLATGAADRRGFVRLAVALGVESLLVNQVVKRMFERERPDHTSDRPHHLRTPSTSSFPSGHASSAAMAVTLLNHRARGKPLTAALGAVVASSRVHVRIHHASDVVVGAMVGRALGLAWRRRWPIR